jgi:hypothetical protein
MDNDKLIRGLVKGLVWRQSGGDYKAGEAFITRSAVSFAPIEVILTRNGWWLNVDCKTYPDLAAAQAAAEADYRARIAAALDGDALAKLIREAEARGMERAAATAYRICAETRHVTLGRQAEEAIRAEAAAIRGDTE